MKCSQFFLLLALVSIAPLLPESLAADGFVSSAGAPVAEAPPDGIEFDEAAIERTIAEINDAIRRTAARKPS